MLREVMIPPKEPGLLIRPRLNDLLSKSVKHNFVKIIAGAGYGKTQTISMFLYHNHYRVAWLQLSKLDNFPARFWEGFLYAISLQNRDIAAQLKQLCFPESLEEYNQFLCIFAENMQIGEPFIFVFDDFYLIHDESIKNFVEYLSIVNIENFCVILISRTNTDFENNFKHYFTEEDLSFTLSETEEYFKMKAIKLPESEIAKIQTYTNGWPLAINLAALDLKKNDKAFIDPLVSIKPTTFQLIEKEIFSIYTKRWQEFLIKLSLLEEFPAKLLWEFTNESIGTIMDILNNNMFIYYNFYTEKYYFHHIFLDFLDKKQIYLHPHSIKKVYLIAAEWYAKNGSNINAMTYYSKCGRYGKIWEIILSTPPERHPKEKASLFIHFLNNFTEAFIKKHPMVRVVRAAYMVNNLELDLATKDLLDLIEELKALPETKENKAVIGESYIILAFIRLTQKDHSFAYYFKMADTCLPNGSMFDYSNIKVIDSNDAFTPNSLEPEKMDKLLNNLFEAIPYASKLLHGLGYGVEYLSAAEISYFKGNLVKSQEYVFEAIYRARQKKQHDIVCNSYFLLMRISSAKGNYDAMINYMKQLREYAQNFAGYLSILDIAEGWFFIRIGESENVAKWLLDDSLNTKLHPPISVGRDRLIRALYFLEESRYAELLAFLRQLDDLYQEKELWLGIICIRILKALTFYYIGNMPECTATLQSLYDMVHKNNFIMQFVEMGGHMCNMLGSIRKTDNHSIPDRWLDNVYSKASTYSKRQAFFKTKHHIQKGSVNDTQIHLTKREKEILKDLCQGLTREELAVSLNISVNTIKTTLRNIYSKLGAVNSADAVRIAMQMKII